MKSQPSRAPTAPQRSIIVRRQLLRRAALWPALPLALWQTAATAAHAAEPRSADAHLPQTLRFGILPIGGALDSRNDWEPLLNDLGRALGRRIVLLSVTSYDALAGAIQRGEVDMAFLSGRMALDAVTQHGMGVVAQVTRHDGLPGYRAILLTRKTPPFNTLKHLLAEPERWRLARGEARSLSGFVVPQVQLFLRHNIAMETRFRSEIIGTHQRTALAVANSEADVATNNSADFERFRLQFPAEAALLHVIWESELIPHGQIVMRRSFGPAFRTRVQNHLMGYGRGRGPRGDAERAVLKALHDFAGFLPADNDSLLGAVQLNYQLARQQTLAAEWINDAARQARLARVEAEFRNQLRALGVSP